MSQVSRNKKLLLVVLIVERGEFNKHTFGTMNQVPNAQVV